MYIFKNNIFSLKKYLLFTIQKFLNLNPSNSTTEYMFFKLSRIALKYGLKALDIKQNDTILLPDYICEVVPYELTDYGINIKYYHVNKELGINFDELTSLIDSSVKALLVVNYFGIYNNLQECIFFTQKNNIFLIEDNAHGFGSRYKGRHLGSFGDIAIASPRKTLPIISGGLLYSKHSLETPILLKFSDNFLIAYCKYYLKYFLFSFTTTSRLYPKYNDPYAFHESLAQNESIDAYSKEYLLNVDKKSFEQRYKIYNIWYKFVLSCGLQPVYKNIDDGTVPMVFPAFANNRIERQKWLAWGKKHKYDVHTWPRLPDEQISENSNAYKLWEKMLCFPITFDIDPDLLEKRLEELNDL